MFIKDLLSEFISKISSGELEIYNEASIQYELAIFLRQRLPNYKVQLERSIRYFGLKKQGFEKREIDIVIYDTALQDKHAIELKYPTNGQYPEQMFSFCKDIRFLEQLAENGFHENLFIVFADDANFWTGKSAEDSIYRFFRGGIELQGTITKPTGKKSHEIELRRNYTVKWENMNEKLKYWIAEI
ncbi:hypothetical protein COV53_00605 [Candidatus Gottesmanbacteria bacterium CG11_big_fil_rev_8_21_14_0_20_37_11]|uniref:Restriction endonuclease n=3 Tax=Candidatus Gottesmaniibacteriota TaxID=1752720 RepID=A0A2M7RQQ0_9BACT|nr:MAG: hypothetical protein AUJ73_01160 [Candidatus Gottesmanbacteria bacterium CG1_02_37_22]PIP32986.1 MAG: hypothetical protein COX23_01845 [Candidatus Gottesmanbacteria bacterium CG23_combo_of_CG06-09_8_20_14_all_37_19]PIR08899.1 MAG: hypothetical protein COV53_00605 [Candidatus Gottesmanbacteria bacterium CG11_big_fil_rev_8_21_14_0_20_37_11]PIZ02379.1 MAG: hypothetical protein COY59_05180 [Candidatus Gottesmanbacteria bacterium CG_4_10_14_0_8_um_filter_37_24]